LDCGLLQAAIKTDAFQERFSVCKGDEEVHIIDTSKSFANCTLEDVCKKSLFVDSGLSNIGKKDVIEIYKIDRKKNIFTLYFHRLATGATLILKLKYEKEKAKLIGYKVGAF